MSDDLMFADGMTYADKMWRDEIAAAFGVEFIVGSREEIVGRLKALLDQPRGETMTLGPNTTAEIPAAAWFGDFGEFFEVKQYSPGPVQESYQLGWPPKWAFTRRYTPALPPLVAMKHADSTNKAPVNPTTEGRYKAFVYGPVTEETRARYRAMFPKAEFEFESIEPGTAVKFDLHTKEASIAAPEDMPEEDSDD